MSETMAPDNGEQVEAAAVNTEAGAVAIGATEDTLVTHMPIADIEIGARHRTDMGDIAGLAATIADVGLLHPIVVKPDGTLIAGGRRLEACKRLGWTEIPVHVVSLDEIARGELAENFHRKDFTITEALAIAEALAVVEREAAKARQVEGGRSGGKSSGKLPEASRGDSRDKIAGVTGYSATTLRNAKAVVDAAEADPGRFRHLVDEMNQTGKINRAHQQLKREREPNAARGGRPLTTSEPKRKGVPTEEQRASLSPAVSDVPKVEAPPAAVPPPANHMKPPAPAQSDMFKTAMPPNATPAPRPKASTEQELWQQQFEKLANSFYFNLEH